MKKLQKKMEYDDDLNSKGFEFECYTRDIRVQEEKQRTKETLQS
jgi:hypothetical protein